MIIIAFATQFFIHTKMDTISYSSALGAFLIGVFYVFLTDFIISKNDLTQRNSYGIMVFGLLLLAFPEAFGNINIVSANLLVFFALRRLFSLHSKRSLTKKFFDATFWISIAALFYAWAILYLLIVIAALMYYWQSELRYAVVVLLAFVTVMILLVVYNIILKNEYLVSSNFNFNLSLDFSSYNSAFGIARLTIVATIYFWSLVYYLRRLPDRNRKMRPIYILVLISSFIALVILLIAPNKNGSEYVFILLPYAIIVANYIEAVQDSWFKDIFVALLILIPIGNLVL